jgi:hypothetical protein
MFPFYFRKDLNSMLIIYVLSKIYFSNDTHGHLQTSYALTATIKLFPGPKKPPSPLNPTCHTIISPINGHDYTKCQQESIMHQIAPRPKLTLQYPSLTV